MLHVFISRVFWFFILWALQVLLFNHIHIGGYATPLCYVYILLILPAGTPRWVYLLTGFFMGLFVDVFTNTPGMAAASLCAVGLVTPLLLSAFAPKDKDDDVLLPSVKTMEWSGFMRYALSATLLHCALFFSIEAFSFLDWKTLMLRILGSTLLTFILILVMEVVRNSSERK